MIKVKWLGRLDFIHLHTFCNRCRVQPVVVSVRLTRRLHDLPLTAEHLDIHERNLGPLGGVPEGKFDPGVRPFGFDDLEHGYDMLSNVILDREGIYISLSQF
jgi:hypothetical protein